MAKELDEQMTIFDFCTDKNNQVCQSNDFVHSKQALSINAAKLVRAAIMQIKYNDEELKPYIVTITELADLLGTSRQFVHREIDKITSEIMTKPLFFKEVTPKKERWVKVAWVKTCKYDSEKGVYITLNDELKPFLLNLKGRYTQYSLDTILSMKSIYAIRIFELLQSELKSNKIIPVEGVDIKLSVDEIRMACDCTDKFKSFTSFRTKVIDKAIDEINHKKTTYWVEYSDIREGKKITGFIFNVKSSYKAKTDGRTIVDKIQR